MSYVRHYTSPDLFITFTCNPQWTKIRQEICPGQSPIDRHNITARVFKQKWLVERISPNEIDDGISAEIPDNEENPLLYEVVKKKLIPGRYGTLNYNYPRMVYRKSSNRDPPQLVAASITGNDNYPLYPR